MRLRGAIQSSLSSVSDGQAALAGGAMSEAYMTCRTEVRSAIDPDLWEEFDRLFLTSATSAPIGREGAARFNEARIRLGKMGGWLEGQIEYLKYTSQLEAEAEAYARAKLKREDGMGFRPPGR